MIYSQSLGAFWVDGLIVETGYSGFGEGKNNPDLQHIPNVGPIPRGKWAISGVYDSKKIGPYAIILEPIDHDALGRTYFRIHGDSRTGNASKGCIILPRLAREQIYLSSDKVLEVVE